MKISKMIFAITVFLLLICSETTKAGDDGYRYNDESVSFSLRPDDYHIQIGQEASFTVEITNNSDCDAYINYIEREFDGPTIQQVHIGERLFPKDTYTMEISIPVADDYLWYEEYGKYYVDYNLKLCYSLDEDYIYAQYLTYQKEKIKLEVLNLFSASEILGIEATGYQPYAVAHQERFVYKYYEYATNIENDIVVHIKQDNLSDRIDTIKVYNNTSDEIVEISPDNNRIDINNFMNVKYYRKKDRIPSIYQYNTYAVFNTGEKYYVDITTSEARVVYQEYDAYDVEIIEQDGQHIVRLYNKTDSDINNLYIDLGMMYTLKGENERNEYIVPLIKAGEYAEIVSEQIIADEKGVILVGEIDENGRLLWWLDYNNEGERDYCSISGFVGYFANGEEPDKSDSPLSSTPTATPTLIPTSMPRPTPVAISTSTIDSNQMKNDYDKIRMRLLVFALLGLLVVLAIVIILAKINNNTDKQ